MKKKLVAFGSSAAALLLPALAFAQQTASLAVQCTGRGSGDATGVLCTIYRLIKIVIPLLILVAVGYFIWGVVEYMIGTTGEEKEGGRGKMINGIVGFAVILGLWGLVSILLQTFGVGTGTGGNVEAGFPIF